MHSFLVVFTDQCNKFNCIEVKSEDMIKAYEKVVSYPICKDVIQITFVVS